MPHTFKNQAESFRIAHSLVHTELMLRSNAFHDTQLLFTENMEAVRSSRFSIKLPGASPLPMITGKSPNPVSFPRRGGGVNPPENFPALPPGVSRDPHITLPPCPPPPPSPFIKWWVICDRLTVIVEGNSHLCLSLY